MLRLENVGLHYGDGPEILDNLSFRLDEQAFCFLTGPSGAGKTSLLKLLYMALRPSSGTISMFGEDVTKLPRRDLTRLRRRIGVVFQDFRLLDHLTAFDNVALPLRVMGKKPSAYAGDVRDLLDWVGLKDQANARPPVLSGGEKQRVAIARAIIHKPEFLLADEPTGNVDPALAKRLLHLFLELNRLGTTILIASHDADLIRQSKAPVLKLESGKLKSAG
jgi:cell division transport system ATP-binding protein